MRRCIVKNFAQYGNLRSFKLIRNYTDEWDIGKGVLVIRCRPKYKCLSCIITDIQRRRLLWPWNL